MLLSDSELKLEQVCFTHQSLFSEKLKFVRLDIQQIVLTIRSAVLIESLSYRYECTKIHLSETSWNVVKNSNLSQYLLR